MTDRELLEKAAKAACIKVDWRECFRCLCYSDSPYGVAWNPLTSDADALRLAVKLDMGIEVHLAAKRTSVGNGSQDTVVEKHKGDPYAATRRAIVTAAAALGDTPSAS